MRTVTLKPGGFPLETVTFKHMQEAYLGGLNAIGAWAGNCILTGIQNLGNENYSAGWIVYEGEMIPFEGGVYQQEVSIIETVTFVEYEETGLSQEAYKTKTAKFGNIAGAIAVFGFSSLGRLPHPSSNVPIFWRNQMVVHYTRDSSTGLVSWRRTERKTIT